ncbi:MAG: response regulator [Clostridia bacterium]|nr:response regulator [Clostridia bacterium]
MKSEAITILIIEDDIKERNKIIECSKSRKDVEIVAATDSDIEGLKEVKMKRPEGIILDIELNNSARGNTDSIQFLSKLKTLEIDYEPIVIVTTHINSKRTYEVLHRNGVDLILYKNHPKYSCDYVLNSFINLRKDDYKRETISKEKEEIEERDRISKCIYKELDLIGIIQKLKGRQYIHDAILYLIENENSEVNVIHHLTKIHKKSGSTITNGIQNAIIHAWRVSPFEELSVHYDARINYETGLPTPMEFIYYYVEKVKQEI